MWAASPTLVAAFFVKGRVGLKWQMVEGAGEYRVYRKGTGSFELIATVSEDHYFDEAVSQGQTYYYKIAITGPDGKEAFSAEKSVTIPGQTGEFLPPIWVGVRIERDKIYLNWDDVPGAVAYNVYRSATSGTGYEVVGNTQSSSHADNLNVEPGKTYYYVLTAMNADFQETPHSEERSIKFGMSAEERKQAEAEAKAVKLVPLKLSHVGDLEEGPEGGSLNQPSDICGNSKGQVYVADALNARIHCYDASGKKLFTFGADVRVLSNPEDGAFRVPYTIHVDNKDNVFVGDTERHDIQMFTADGKFSRRIAVKTEPGMQPLRPNGICRIDDNRLAVTDTGNHRLLFVDMDGNILKQIGKRGSGPGEFSFPGQVDVGPNRELFVIDVINSRVQVFDLEGNYLREFGEGGQGAGQFGRPVGLAVDSKGQIWLSDSMSGIIQVFSREGEVKSVLGSAQDEWRFAGPGGIHLVGDRLYIVDRLNNKVVVFDLG